MTATYTIQQKIQFLQQIYPYAVNTSNTSGLSLELMLSQAVQETGWGEKVLPGTNNIFNIKADSSWSGPTATFTVREFIGDHYEFVVSEFRVYPSYAESFADRVTFLSENPGYAKLFDPSIMGDLAKEADALQNAHYATDPSYAKHLIEIPTGRTFKAAIATLNYHVSDVALQLELDKALGILDELDKIDLGQSIVQRPLDSTATSFAAASIYVTPVRLDPLVLDLDGDGIETLPINTTTPVMFDLNNSGVKKSVGWIKSDDGFLVMDRNGNGTIDTGAELFGDATPLSGGGTAADGFAALAQLDSNLDGQMTADDSAFANLRVWRDLNQNGLSEAGELSTLAELDITSINVAASSHTITVTNGNLITDQGTYTRGDGTTGSAGETANSADVQLATDPFHTTFTTPLPLTAEALTLPDMNSSAWAEAANDAVFEMRKMG